MLQAAAVAVLIAMTPPAAAQATAGFSLGEWSRLDERERKVTMVAAVEGLMLAASAGGANGVDGTCVSAVSLPKLDTDLLRLAKARDGQFVDMMMEASGCTRS